MKLRIYEVHIFELRNEEINVKKILAVINATYFVLPSLNKVIIIIIISCEKKAWKNQACRDSNPDLCDTSAALHWYRRGQGSNPGKPDFFQAFFSQLHKLR